jgi:transcriptional regulator of acetoin/glycerol metabolism
VEREAGTKRHFSPPSRSENGATTLQDMERQHILRVLQEAQWNKSRAARALGIERKTLYEKARRLGIELKAGKQ